MSWGSRRSRLAPQRRLRLVIDASVLLAAPAGRPDGPPSLLIEAARQGTIEMIACETLLGELERGLEGDYFRERPVSGSACLTSHRPIADGLAHGGSRNTRARIVAEYLGTPPALVSRGGGASEPRPKT